MSNSFIKNTWSMIRLLSGMARGTSCDASAETAKRLSGQGNLNKNIFMELNVFEKSEMRISLKKIWIKVQWMNLFTRNYHLRRLQPKPKFKAIKIEEDINSIDDFLRNWQTSFSFIHSILIARLYLQNPLQGHFRWHFCRKRNKSAHTKHFCAYFFQRKFCK